jgi:capsular polysaccharide biosynthesis protein
VGVYDAVRQYWQVVLLPVVALCAVAVVLAQHRAPTYHAEARLNVGGFNITAQEVPGFAGGAIQLATTYSRAVYSPSVLRPVAKRLHRSRARIMSEVSASPVAESPVIRVDGSSKSRKEAIAVANATAHAITSYAVKLARSNPDSSRLLRQYVAARKKQLAAQRKHGLSSTQADRAALRARTLASLYGFSVGGQASSNVVQVLAPALTASNDRASVRQQYLAGALLGGLAIGVLLAMLMARSEALGPESRGLRNGRPVPRAAPRPEEPQSERPEPVRTE